MYLLNLILLISSTPNEVSSYSIITITNPKERFSVEGDIDTTIQDVIKGNNLNFEYRVDENTQTFLNFGLQKASLVVLRPSKKCQMTAQPAHDNVKRKSFDLCTRISTEFDMTPDITINITSAEEITKCLLKIENSESIKAKTSDGIFYNLTGDLELQVNPVQTVVITTTTTKEGKSYLNVGGLTFVGKHDILKNEDDGYIFRILVSAETNIILKARYENNSDINSTY